MALGVADEYDFLGIRGLLVASDHYLLIHILNKSIRLGGVTALVLDEAVEIRPIQEPHYGAILDSAPEQYKDNILTNSKCIYIKCDSNIDVSEKLRYFEAVIKYVFNFYAEEGTLFFSVGMLARQAKKFKIIKNVIFFQNTDRFNIVKIGYTLSKKVTPDEIKSYFSTVRRVIDNNKGVFVTINRINLFVVKDQFEDRIVDLTIALESLIPGRDELRFRFALYLSFIVESDPTKRNDVFNTFRDLYDVRSRIVHGGDSDDRTARVDDRIREKIKEIQRLAFAAINYYIYFLSKNELVKWDAHLRSLVVSGARRLTDETGEE